MSSSLVHTFTHFPVLRARLFSVRSSSDMIQLPGLAHRNVDSL